MTESGEVNWERVKLILAEIAKIENALFRKRHRLALEKQQTDQEDDSSDPVR